MTLLKKTKSGYAVRITHEAHRLAKQLAEKEERSIAKIIERSIKHYYSIDWKIDGKNTGE